MASAATADWEIPMVKLPEQPQNPAPAPSPKKRHEQEFIEAVDRIFKRYGTDLSAFQKDFENQLVKLGTKAG